MFSTRVAEKKSLKFNQNRINKIKTAIVKVCESKLYLPLQNPVALPTVQWEPLQFLTIFSENTKSYGTTEIRTRTYSLKFFFLTPLPRQFI